MGVFGSAGRHARWYEASIDRPTITSGRDLPDGRESSHDPQELAMIEWGSAFNGRCGHSGHHFLVAAGRLIFQAEAMNSSRIPIFIMTCILLQPMMLKRSPSKCRRTTLHKCKRNHLKN